MIIINASDLKKIYPSKPPVAALRGFSLQIEEGETIALLGPNGAGKTTFLRILTGILIPESGSITIFDKDPVKFAAQVACYLRFLPETPFLLRNNTIWENAYFWFQYWNEKFPKNDLRKIFECFNLLERANEPISRYSRGMLQKAALSFMLATKVPIIILDEPTLGLDVVTIKEVVDIINALKKKQKTIVIASHSMTFVEEVADRVAIINEGKVLEIEKIQDFIAKHGNPRQLISYRYNNYDKLYTEVFNDHKDCNNRLRDLLSEDIEIVEIRRECDSLEQILRRLLSEKIIK